MDILAFIYLISFLPFYCYCIIKRDIITNKINIKNSYYYLCGFMLFNFGMFFICLNKYTLGSGLFLVFMSIYNILMGVFQESSDYRIIVWSSWSVSLLFSYSFNQEYTQKSSVELLHRL